MNTLMSACNRGSQWPLGHERRGSWVWGLGSEPQVGQGSMDFNALVGGLLGLGT